LGAIESENAENTIDAIERDGERRAKGAVLSGVVQVTGFDRRIAVENCLIVFDDPAGKTLADGDFERVEEPQVFAADVFGRQLFVAPDIDYESFVRNQALEANADEGERLLQAEGTAEILRELIEHLRFLRGGGDGRHRISRSC